jgi:hypothetical protein
VKNELGIKVGDIFSSSWGYDQTNVNFYEVVSVTARTVKVREIGAEYSDDGGFRRLRPAKGRFLEKSHLRRYRDNEAVTKRPSKGYRDTINIKVRDFAWARPTSVDSSHYDTIAAGLPGH